MKPFISFVSLPSHMRLPPMALLSLASYLNAKTEYRASVVNLKGVANFEKTFLAHLREEKPKFVGFPCFTCDYNIVMKLSRLVKKHIKCNIIVGNVHASLYPEDFLFKNSPVDYVVIGEGEITLEEFFKAYNTGKSVVSVPGIAALDSYGRVVKGGKRELIRDLSILPPIDTNLINIKPYLDPSNRVFWSIPIRGMRVHTSRGCPSKCEFCAANTLWKCNKGPAVRFHPIDKIIDYIVHLKNKYDIQGIFLTDDSFLINKQRVLDFCRKIKRIGIFWGAQGRVTQIDEEMVAEMKKSGCLILYFGAESGSNTILKRINKRQTVEQIIYAFDLCKKYGIKQLVDIMCNHPGETEKDILLTRRLLKRIKPDELSRSVMTPYPGTAIYEKYVHDKLNTEQYYLLSNIGPDIAKYFKMCEHNIVSSAKTPGN